MQLCFAGRRCCNPKNLVVFLLSLYFVIVLQCLIAIVIYTMQIGDLHCCLPQLCLNKHWQLNSQKNVTERKQTGYYVMETCRDQHDFIQTGGGNHLVNSLNSMCHDNTQ